MRTAATITVLTSFIFASLPARAADTVESLMERGFQERKNADYEKALQTFRQAHAQAPSAHSLAQIGLTEQSLGRWLDSETHLAEALRQPDHPWIAKNRLHLENALSEVRKHIGTLMIRGGISGAAVYVGDTNRGTLPLAAPLRIDKESVDIQIVAPGRQPFIATNVKITPGAVAMVDVDAPPPGAGRGVPGAPSADISNDPVITTMPSSASWRRPTAFSLLGVGAASAALGTYFLLRPPSRDAGSCSGLPAGFTCAQQEANMVPGWALLGAGVALGVTGGIVLYSSPKGELALTPTPSQLLVFKGTL